MNKKYTCNCGAKTEKMISFFHKENGMRITMCEKCGIEMGFFNNNKYTYKLYSELSKEQNKTPA